MVHSDRSRQAAGLASAPPAETFLHGDGTHTSAHGRASVLVVDDDPRNLQAVEAALEDLDVDLTMVTSADEALREVLRHEHALAVLDVRLPASGGFEVAEMIRARASTRHIPIIFLTAYGAEGDIRRAYELGAADYLAKPFAPEVLRAKVQVFVELRNRTVEVVEQARRLRVLEGQAAERRLEQAMREWETVGLRKEIERERRLNARLEEADRRKDEFLAVLAHELRNPLSPLVMGLELMRNDVQGVPRAEKTCAAMSRQVGHLVRLVDDLLDVSRISMGKIEMRREPIDLRGCIEDAIETCAPALAQAGHRLEVDLGDVELVSHADRARVTQIATNLLTNAIRYTPPGGEIHVSACLEAADVVLRVRDNGIGIEPEMRDRIFETFVQAHVGAGGLGLGLTLVKQVVSLHGGEVIARSEGRGLGSEFEVRLPRLDAKPEVATETRPALEAVPDPLRVLIVDDNEDLREIEREMLSSWGHDVHVAHDGTQAIEAATTWKPDAILLDIGLPDLDGYTVAERIRAQMGADCPLLVALTGFGRKEDRDRAHRAGFDAHLVKPPLPEDLRDVLARAARE